MKLIKVLQTLPLTIFLIACIACSSGSSNGGSTNDSSSPSSKNTSNSSAASVSASNSSSSSSSNAGTSSSDIAVSSSSSASSGNGITANEAAAAMGAGFNLGQMFDNDQHSPTLNEAKGKIDAYYALGYRNVRIPVSWTIEIDGSRLADANGVVDRNNGRLAELIKVVDYALALQDLYVVINTHHEAVIKDNNQAAVLEQLWDDISSIFSDRSYRLLFEILNEPHLSNSSAMAPANLRAMTGRAYDKIRARNPNRIIIIGGNQWFGAQEMALTWPNLEEVGGGNDQYLMSTFHHYNPWEFHGLGNLDTNWTSAHITDPINTMKSWAESVGQGMPIYIGEWGTNWEQYKSEMDCNNIRAWYAALHSQYAAPEGIPTAVWDDGGWFKIYDHATDSFNNNLYECIIGGACDYSADDNNRINSACM